MRLVGSSVSGEAWHGVHAASNVAAPCVPPSSSYPIPLPLAATRPAVEPCCKHGPSFSLFLFLSPLYLSWPLSSLLFRGLYF